MNLESIDKAYLYMNWRLAGWFKGFFDDGFYVWKAVLLIDVLEIIIVLFIIPSVVSLIINQSVLPEPENQKYFALAFSLGIAILNNFILTNRWQVYETEFKNYLREQHLLYGWIIGGIILFIIASLIGSFYLLSQSSLAYGS